MNKKLMRSVDNRVLGGVCGGIGEYISIDPVFVRLIFLATFLILDIGFWVYLILWVIIPAADQTPNQEWSERFKGVGEDVRTAVQQPNTNYAIYIGGTLVLLGASLLLKQYFPDFFALTRNIAFPLVLIAAGALIFVRTLRER
jgi:phage shock protein PspC (stress-responsive transcriptional regulator)